MTYPDSAEIGMRRVEQQVSFGRNYNTGNIQHAVSGITQPSAADFLEVSTALEGSPVLRKLFDIDFQSGDIARNFRGYQQIIGAQRLVLDEHFEKGQ